MRQGDVQVVVERVRHAALGGRQGGRYGRPVAHGIPVVRVKAPDVGGGAFRAADHVGRPENGGRRVGGILGGIMGTGRSVEDIDLVGRHPPDGALPLLVHGDERPGIRPHFHIGRDVRGRDFLLRSNQPFELAGNEQESQEGRNEQVFFHSVSKLKEIIFSSVFIIIIGTARLKERKLSRQENRPGIRRSVTALLAVKGAFGRQFTHQIGFRSYPVQPFRHGIPNNLQR